MIKKPDTLILSIAILCGISLSAQSLDTCITEILRFTSIPILYNSDTLIIRKQCNHLNFTIKAPYQKKTLHGKCIVLLNDSIIIQETNYRYGIIYDEYRLNNIQGIGVDIGYFKYDSISLSNIEAISLYPIGYIIRKVDEYFLSTTIETPKKIGTWTHAFSNGFREIKHYTNDTTKVLTLLIDSTNTVNEISEINFYSHLNIKLIYSVNKFGVAEIVNGNGIHTTYFADSNKIRRTAEYKDGYQHGAETYYDENGNITSKKMYKMGLQTE